MWPCPAGLRSRLGWRWGRASRADLGGSGSAAQRQESSQAGSGLERAAHRLALRCGIFMGVWVAAVGTRKRFMSSCTTGPRSGLGSYFTPLPAVAELSEIRICLPDVWASPMPKIRKNQSKHSPLSPTALPRSFPSICPLSDLFSRLSGLLWWMKHAAQEGAPIDT